VVLVISGCVFFYGCGYMLGDLNVLRFFFVLILFVFRMGFLIFRPHIVSLLLGWDGLGLVSYCLVIYYQNIKSYGAGMITVLINRVGDVGLLLSIGFLVDSGGWGIFDFEMEGILWIFWLLFLAGITRRAQIPFSAWLPAAMAAPTPVSSLVHSSTLVTAGVYLIIRVGVYFSDFIICVVVLISLITMFMAGLGAIFENDIRKVIALSTLRQLGLILRVIGFGGYMLAYYYLIIHAIFRSLMFLCAGYLIHQISGIQDLRLLGGISLFSPLVCYCLNVSNFSLCGFPFLSGFYSRDLIIDFMVGGGSGLGSYFIFMVSCGLTVMYRFKIFIFVCVKGVGFKGYEVLGEIS